MLLRQKPWAVIAAATLLVAGCGISVTSSSAFDGVGGEVPGGGAGSDASGGATISNSDGGVQRVDAAAAPTGTDNPLCRVTVGGMSPTCDPQDENKAADGGTTATQTCISLLDIDGGDAGAYACHVAVDNGDVRPMCFPEGQSRDSCVSQQSCSAGYGCVGNDTGTCRRYCCNPYACDSASFCDIQPIFKTSDVKVPVCMPIAQCKLLSDSCPNQTCSVVDEQRGVTSCVDIGPRGVGDECETDHCAKDLVCLGTIGARKCFKLCDMSGSTMYDCPSGQHCKANSVIFPNPEVNIGICQ